MAAGAVEATVALQVAEARAGAVAESAREAVEGAAVSVAAAEARAVRAEAELGFWKEHADQAWRLVAEAQAARGGGAGWLAAAREAELGKGEAASAAASAEVEGRAESGKREAASAAARAEVERAAEGVPGSAGHTWATAAEAFPAQEAWASAAEAQAAWCREEAKEAQMEAERWEGLARNAQKQAAVVGVAAAQQLARTEAAAAKQRDEAVARAACHAAAGSRESGEMDAVDALARVVEDRNEARADRDEARAAAMDAMEALGRMMADRRLAAVMADHAEALVEVIVAAVSS